MSSDVIELLKVYPILPTLQLLINSLLIITALFLLIVLMGTKLHTNCRYLLTIWISGLTTIFISHGMLGALNLSQEDGFLAENMIEPASRNHIYMVEMTSIFFTTCIEVMITIERVLSSVNPEIYHQNHSLAWTTLIPSTAIAIFVSILSGYVSSDGQFIVTGSVSFVLDISTISINTFAIRYCKRRYVELHENGSLNARYQVKESSDMASAMQYAFIISICMKNSVNTIFLLFCLRVDPATNACVPLLFETHWGILETLYSMNMSINGGFQMVWLLLNHPRLLRNAQRLAPRLWATIDSPNRTITEVSDEKEKESDTYFEKLKLSWL